LNRQDAKAAKKKIKKFSSSLGGLGALAVHSRFGGRS
jgi:hypothetical protein